MRRARVYFLFFLFSCARISVHQTSKLASHDAKKEHAVAYGKHASETYIAPASQPWFMALPSCPCVEPLDDSSWIKSNIGLRRYHRGAKTGYRSASSISTQEGTTHGQQCTYDEEQRLITHGWAAGTPDIVNPITNGRDHRYLDVMTWEHITKGGRDISGLALYHRYWPPNQGQGCPANEISR